MKTLFTLFALLLFTPCVYAQTDRILIDLRGDTVVVKTKILKLACQISDLFTS